jgi:hypothetical protein
VRSLRYILPAPRATARVLVPQGLSFRRAATRWERRHPAGPGDASPPLPHRAATRWKRRHPAGQRDASPPCLQRPFHALLQRHSAAPSTRPAFTGFPSIYLHASSFAHRSRTGRPPTARNAADRHGFATESIESGPVGRELAESVVPRTPRLSSLTWPPWLRIRHLAGIAPEGCSQRVAARRGKRGTGVPRAGRMPALPARRCATERQSLRDQEGPPRDSHRPRVPDQLRL